LSHRLLEDKDAAENTYEDSFDEDHDSDHKRHHSKNKSLHHHNSSQRSSPSTSPSSSTNRNTNKYGIFTTKNDRDHNASPRGDGMGSSRINSRRRLDDDYHNQRYDSHDGDKDRQRLKLRYDNDHSPPRLNFRRDKSPPLPSSSSLHRRFNDDYHHDDDMRRNQIRKDDLKLDLKSSNHHRPLNRSLSPSITSLSASSTSLRSNSLDKFSARRRQEQLDRVGGVQRRSPPPPLTTSFKRSTFGPSSNRTMNKDDDYDIGGRSTSSRRLGEDNYRKFDQSPKSHYRDDMFDEGYTKKENSSSRWNDVKTNTRSNSPRRLGLGGGLGSSLKKIDEIPSYSMTPRTTTTTTTGYNQPRYKMGNSTGYGIDRLQLDL
jgi:hypothetical protein